MNRLLLSLLFGLFLLVLLPGAAQAQSGTITGTLTDSESDEPLPGASVLIASLQAGAAADADGNYTIENVPTGAYTLRISFVGYQTEEVGVTVEEGEVVTRNVALQPNFAELNEVVVTAQGIERQARELGYSVSEIDAARLNKGKETNFVKSLSGKAPGIDVTSQSGNVGGSASIILRGIASLDGDNQPLFVVDGVPIFNSNVSSGTRLSGTYDTGNKASDIDPNNVESVSILKGGAAAARYGSRAKNGVIVITTKQGQNRSQASVQVSSSVLSARPLRLPDFQNEYAQGDQGKYDPTDLDGWGPRINGQEVLNYAEDEVIRLSAAPNNIADFYETGITATNSVSFSNATELGDFRLGVTRTDQGGIVPNSELGKTNLSLNAGTRLDNGFSARVGINYVNEDTKGKVASGGNDPNLLVPNLNSLPRTVSQAAIRDYKNEDGEQRNIGAMSNNPYWQAFENPFTTEQERVFGFARAAYTPVDWLELSARVGTDFYTEDRRAILAKGTLGAAEGAFTKDNVQERQLDVDFILNADRDLSDDFSLNVILGNNVNQRNFDRLRNTADQLDVEGLYSFGNASNNTPTNFSSEQRIIGVYGDVTLGFRDYAFLEVTGRNDWSSTLPDENNSFFYPSANLSLIFTDLLSEEFGIESGVLSYGKVRANYAEVGSDTNPYELAFTFDPVSNVFGQYGTDILFPYGGRTGFEGPGTVPPTNLKPERQKGFEVGTELRFFSSRVTLDFTYYSQRTTEQIISIPVPQSTGYGQFRTNVGETSNKGFEVTLNGGIITTPQFSWRSNLNFTTNQNTVESLAEGVEEITVQSGFNGFQVRAEPGESLGIYGIDFARDEETGLPIIDPTTGLRSAGEDKRLADLYPDFSLGFSNTFDVLGFELGFLIDWKSGGSVFSSTVLDLRGSGLAEETAANREGTFIDEGVIVEQNDAGETTRRPNDVPVQSMEAFWGQYTDQGITEPGIFDADYVKLREVSLGYNLPQRLLNRTPFGSASITIQGRNLLLLYSRVPHIDPETNLFGSGADVGQGYEFGNLPSTRTIGATVNFTF